MEPKPLNSRWLDRRRGGPRVRPVTALLAALALAVYLHTSALAHLEVIASDPAPDAVLTASPEVVRITFSGRIASTSQITVLGPGFEAMQRGPAQMATPSGAASNGPTLPDRPRERTPMPSAPWSSP
jgi:hypothetical protein